MSVPRRLSASDRRAQLLDVAARAFAERGFHGVSMEQLADGAGVTKPVLYQHFASKRELYLATVREAIAEMESQVGMALEDSSDNRERVRDAIAAYFGFVQDRRFRLLLGAERADDQAGRDEVDQAMQRMAQVVGALIAEDAGLDPGEAQLLASGVRGLATAGARWWLEHSGKDRERAVDLLAQLAWRGLASFPGEEQPGA
ncbi:MAG TPA: TetR/AcrR family transcriptional regulator [Egibacteraceae bacterium]|nr:TetR/AcrR family transcriptional regulator [Egibacteraceae bacterium]